MKTIFAALLLILTSLNLFADDSALADEGEGSYNYFLYLQPLAGSELRTVAVGGAVNDSMDQAVEQSLEYTILERDNSSAVVRLANPEPELVVQVSNPEYQDRILRLVAANPLDLMPTSLNFAILSPKNTSHQFEAAWPTGIQPKSVTFISNTLVAIPLLADRGIDIIDITDGSTRRIAPPAAWARHQGFVESLVLPQRGELWVSQMTTAAIHVFDLQTLAYKLTIPTGGSWSKVLAYNPVLDRVFFTHWLSEDVSIINPYTYKEERRADYKAVPRGLTFSADGQSMYLAQYEVAGRSAGRVLKVDLVNLEVSATMGVAGAKRHIVKDQARGLMYVSDMARNIIEVFSLTTDRLLHAIPVSAKPNTIQLSPDGRRLYVSCRGPNNPTLDYLYKGLEMGKVHIVDTATFQVVETHEGGNQPTGLDISPDGRRLVFSDFLDKRIRVYL
ncbi:MAG: YncE family protein, partial [Spirochaetes bacterium]|nr:YncE family protein [Spirochaetota bacterium]MBU0955628.1 YncE family protein [Spirochaetota bacterium]